MSFNREGEMIRLARNGVLVVVFLLLASAATTFADCAWVLWTKDSALDKTGAWSYTAFGPEVFDTRAECEKVGLKYRANRSKSYEDAKKAGFNATPPARYQCLPDTVDPRGPKGK
jgi:hypothetical protein